MRSTLSMPRRVTGAMRGGRADAVRAASPAAASPTLDRGATGAASTAPPPLLAPDDVAAVIARRYELQGELQLLAAERDHVYRLDTGQGAFVVRVSGPTEPAGSLRLQHRVLATIQRRDPELPVPKLVRSGGGNSIVRSVRHGVGWRLRVFTHLAGVPMLAGPRSATQLERIGETLARVDLALAAIRRHQPAFQLMWNLQSAPQLLRYTPDVAGEDRRRFVADILSDFRRRHLPRLQRLPQQALHNDFNPKNVLYRAAGDSTLTGIIDFGDVTMGPRAIDLGVAIARHASPRTLLETAVSVVAGYARLIALRRAEIDLLFSIVRVRLAMRILIRCRRLRSISPPAAELAAIDDAFDLLAVATSVGEPAFSDALRGFASD